MQKPVPRPLSPKREQVRGFMKSASRIPPISLSPIQEERGETDSDSDTSLSGFKTPPSRSLLERSSSSAAQAPDEVVEIGTSPPAGPREEILSSPPEPGELIAGGDPRTMTSNEFRLILGPVSDEIQEFPTKNFIVPG